MGDILLSPSDQFDVGAARCTKYVKVRWLPLAGTHLRLTSGSTGAGLGWVGFCEAALIRRPWR